METTPTIGGGTEAKPRQGPDLLPQWVSQTGQSRGAVQPPGPQPKAPESTPASASARGSEENLTSEKPDPNSETQGSSCQAIIRDSAKNPPGPQARGGRTRTRHRHRESGHRPAPTPSSNRPTPAPPGMGTSHLPAQGHHPPPTGREEAMPKSQGDF